MMGMMEMGMGYDWNTRNMMEDEPRISMKHGIMTNWEIPKKKMKVLWWEIIVP